jgi:hypothetical protein
VQLNAPAENTGPALGPALAETLAARPEREKPAALLTERIFLEFPRGTAPAGSEWCGGQQMTERHRLLGEPSLNTEDSVSEVSELLAC